MIDPKEQREFELRSAAVCGTALAYRDEGEGEPVVFVHGSLSDLRSWKPLVVRIARSYRAISYSRRYARPNCDIEPGTDDPMGVHVNDLVALLRSVGLAPAHLVGSSFGAFVCLLTAIRAPELVRSLVLQEPPVLSLFVSNPPRPRELWRLFVRRPRTGLAIFGFAAKAVIPAQKAFQRGDDELAMSTFLRGALGHHSYAQLSLERKEECRENLNTLREQLLGAGFPPISEDDVRSVRIPTLLMTGQHSPSVFQRLTDRLAVLLPNAHRIEIAAASHLMSEENPSATNDAILDFLAHAGNRNVRAPL